MRRMFKIFKLRRVRQRTDVRSTTRSVVILLQNLSPKKAYRTRRNTRVRQIITIAVYQSPEGMRTPSVTQRRKKDRHERNSVQLFLLRVP
jgi:hypothetical protein